MAKRIEFDRHGKCPLCHKIFKSVECSHTFDYVMRIVETVNSKFNGDVKKLQARK